MQLTSLPMLFGGLLTLAACKSHGGDIVSQGTIEVQETDVAPNVTGRVSRIWVDEGAMVKRGDTLMTLTATTLPADIQGYQARVDQARAQLAELERGSRREDIAAAEAGYRGAQAEYERAVADSARVARLGQTGVVGQREVDRARTAALQAASSRDAARSALDRLQRGARPEEIQAARARVAEAEAALAAGNATSGELTLVAPSDGVVLPRFFEVGELVSAGHAALTLADLARPWVRVYVGELDLPSVRLGELATGRLDGRPDVVYPGRVVAINHKAEFTPRVALTEEERHDLVFGVKVALTDTTGSLRPGLPMTVYFTRSAPAPADSGSLEEARP
ncbi:MAG TPA: efflux RND transporter periplasmic adaptor subunit [Gemmatimonadales bacterium]|nr:efflux RND transporter periplasmic adaptor subunit [Gemmatimonadales bacterium]